ncbi:MAG: hypothetical protein ACOYK6_05915 [Chthoniobacterales bacterium]
MNLEHSLATLPGLFWICLILPASLALAGIFLARKLIAPNKRNPHHDIAHAILGPVGTIFGILGAFMVATTWHEYEDTSLNLHEESNALRSLYFNAEAFAPQTRDSIQTLCKNYRKAVLENEWKIIQKGKDTLLGDATISQLYKIYLSYPLITEKERIYYRMSVEKLEKLRKYRELRIEDSCTGLLPLLWILFLLGGTTLVTITLLMISSPGQTHALMVVLLAMLIGIMTFAIISLDFPFIGFTKMSTAPLDMIPMENMPLSLRAAASSGS